MSKGDGMRSVTWEMGSIEELNTLADAVDQATDQDNSTWLVNTDGKKVAAVVTVEMAEYAIRHGYFAY